MSDYVNQIYAGIISLCFGAVTWLVRSVLTNQKQIAMLQQEIEARDKRREEDRTVWKELKEDVKEIKRDILDLYKSKD